jgi:hypothetical protein
MLRTPIFWLMFLMMTLMSTSGLMVISQMGAFTKDFGMAEMLVFGLPVLPLALSLDRVTNGLTRPFFGWGEIFSLFPSTLTDTFGTRHATSNYGFLYIAQGVGSVLGGPVAALLHLAAGSWTPVFELIIGMNFATAILAQFALKPMRRRWSEITNREAFAAGPRDVSQATARAS